METDVPITNTSFFEGFKEVKDKDAVLTSDDKILVTAETEGWKDIKNYINAVIEELESGAEINPGESLEVYAARRMAIDISKLKLKQIIDHVESIAKYVRENREPK
jgi:hypothetical protein